MEKLSLFRCGTRDFISKLYAYYQPIEILSLLLSGTRHFYILGDMKAAEVADIMNKYGKDLEATMNKHNNSKQRQAGELHRKLAQRRKAKEDALRDKHLKEV